MGRPPPLVIAGIVAGALFMEMLDTTVILTALPRMAESFRVSPLDLGIGVTGYMLALAALLPASGWIADHYGTRRVFLFAIAGFALASVLCGLSTSLPMFAAARVLQGGAAALMSPVARLAMLKVLERREMARAMNMGAMAALMGPTIGPPLGGFITTYGSWRWIFLLNIPIAIIGIIVVWRRFPDLRATHERPFDRNGCALNAIAMVAVLYGLQWLSENGRDWRVGAVLTISGLIVGWLAIRHARRDAHPLLNFTALATPSYRASIISGALFRVALFVPMFVMPLLLQLGLGMSAFVAGMYILVGAAADMLAKLFAIRALRTFGHRKLLIWSAALYALFPLAMLLVDAETSWLLLSALLAFGGATRSLHMTAINTLTFVDVPQAQVSGASTLAALTQQLAQALAVAAAALVVDLTVWWLGGTANHWQVVDFHIVLLFATLAALLTLRWYWPMSPLIGAEVSGHRP